MWRLESSLLQSDAPRPRISTGSGGPEIRAKRGTADFATESEFIFDFSVILRVHDAYHHASPLFPGRTHQLLPRYAMLFNPSLALRLQLCAFFSLSNLAPKAAV
jgi:hypothetical protein